MTKEAFAVCVICNSARLDAAPLRLHFAGFTSNADIRHLFTARKRISQRSKDSAANIHTPTCSSFL